MSEREREFNPTDLLRLLRRRLIFIVCCGIVIGAFMTLVALASYPVYEAKGLFQIATPGGGLSLVSEFFSLGGGTSHINSEVEIVRSRSIAESVIDRLDLNVRIEDVTYGGHISRATRFVLSDRLKRGLREFRITDVIFPAESIDKSFIVHFTDDSGNYRIVGPGGELGTGHQGDPFESEQITFTATLMRGRAGTKFRLTPRDSFITLQGFRETLRVSTLGGATRTNLIQVSFRSPHPTLASDVINAVMDEYEQKDLEWKSWQGEEQTKELEARLAETRVELEVTANELVAYKNQYGVIQLDNEASLAITDLSRREAERIDVNLRLSLFQQMYTSLARDLDSDNFAVPPSLTSDSVIQQLATDHARLNIDLQDLLLDYTENHPSVIAKRESVRSVRESIMEALQATIDGLRDQQGDLGSVIAQMETRLYSIPGVERELIELQRNREIADETYRLLTRRLGEAQLVEATFSIGNRVIDYAVPPTRPVAPSIKRNLAMGGILGLVFGAFTAFLLEIGDRRIRRREDLESLLNGTQISVVTRDDPDEISRAASVLALASMHSANNSIALLAPGPSTAKSRKLLEAIIEEVSGSLSPVLLIDASADPDDKSFFGADAHPGISEIADGGNVEPQNRLEGRIKVLPAGHNPRSAHITNHHVRRRITELQKTAAFTLIYAPSLQTEPAVRGWAAKAGNSILVVIRNSDLRSEISNALTALNEDNIPLLGALLLE